MFGNHRAKLLFRTSFVLQILATDLRLQQQSVVNLRTVRVLLTKKLILTDCGTQRMRVRQHASLFGQQISNRRNRRWSLRSPRFLVINHPECGQHILVLLTGALIRRARFQLST